jgi:hypothetical protein
MRTGYVISEFEARTPRTDAPERIVGHSYNAGPERRCGTRLPRTREVRFPCA